MKAGIVQEPKVVAGAGGIHVENIQSPLTVTEYTAQRQQSSLFLIITGAGKCTNNVEETAFEAPCLVWLPAQSMSTLSLVAGSRGFALRTSDIVIGQSIPSGTISAHVRKAITSQIIQSQIPATTAAKFKNLFEQIESETLNARPGARAVIHHCISLLLIEIWRTSNPAQGELDELPHQIVDEFLHLVEIHLQSHWTVQQYAERIGVSRDRLNSTVRRSLDTSPHRHIQARMVEEAKSLLLRSNMHVAEIAYKLGFTDAAYFNRFFQRHADVAPGKFRLLNSTTRHRAPRETAFHAWP